MRPGHLKVKSQKKKKVCITQNGIIARILLQGFEDAQVLFGMKLLYRAFSFLE